MDPSASLQEGYVSSAVTSLGTQISVLRGWGASKTRAQWEKPQFEMQHPSQAPEIILRVVLTNGCS